MENISENTDIKNTLKNFFSFKIILIKQYDISETTIIKKKGCIEKPKIFTINKKQQKI